MNTTAPAAVCFKCNGSGTCVKKIKKKKKRKRALTSDNSKSHPTTPTTIVVPCPCCSKTKASTGILASTRTDRITPQSHLRSIGGGDQLLRCISLSDFSFIMSGSASELPPVFAPVLLLTHAVLFFRLREPTRLSFKPKLWPVRC